MALNTLKCNHLTPWPWLERVNVMSKMNNNDDDDEDDDDYDDDDNFRDLYLTQHILRVIKAISFPALNTV